MTIREDITTVIGQWIDDRGEIAVISPTALAVATMRYFEDGGIEPHVEYTSLEHFKQIARQVLAHRYDDEGEDNEAYGGDQGELFSGSLQDRYPLPRRRGAEPQYKLRRLLTATERAWNVEQLRKSAMARLEHADALEAEGRGGFRAA
jgi:hypothetical protein